MMILDPAKRYASAAAEADSDESASLGTTRSWRLRTEVRRDEGRGGIEIAQRRRDAIRDAGGLASETYRDVTVDDALFMLV